MIKSSVTFAAGLLVAGLVTVTPGMAGAATAYVSDELTVPLRSGPSNAHRIVHAAVPTGTRMETLATDEAAGFTQIRTSRGTEGWIRTQYLKFEPIASMQLQSANQQLANVRKELRSAQDRIASLTASNREQSSANAQGQNRIESLQEELSELQKISSSAVATHERMLSLEEENTPSAR